MFATNVINTGTTTVNTVNGTIVSTNEQSYQISRDWSMDRSSGASNKFAHEAKVHRETQGGM